MSSDFSGGSDPLEFLMRNLLGGQMGSAFGGGTDFRWEMVSAMALLSLAGPDGAISETNVDPEMRIQLEQLFDLVEMRFETLELLPTLPKSDRTIEVMNHQSIIKSNLTRSKSTIQALLDALTPETPFGSTTDLSGTEEMDASAQMERMMMMMQRIAAPAMVASQFGWIIGQIAKTSLGQLELPMPRNSAGGIELVSSNLAAFSARHGLDVSQVALWIMMRELVHLAILSSPSIKGRLETLIALHIADSRSATNSTMQALSEIDPTDPDAMKALLSNPSSLISTAPNEAQLRTQSDIEAILSFVEGMVQYQTRIAAAYLIGDFAAIEDATTEHRFNPDNPANTLAAMLGLSITPAMVEQGLAFISGILERDGSSALVRLWTDEQMLPTPAEISAPGLWLARIEYL